jgi:acylphosphatase
MQCNPAKAALPVHKHTAIPLLRRTYAARVVSLSATIYRFVSEHKQARRYFVSGIVQGVGFRYFTQNAAERLHLSGYTKNLPDGRVEAYAIGTPEQLAKLRSALERGPWGASVSEVAEEQAAIDSNYANGFVITY